MTKPYTADERDILQVALDWFRQPNQRAIVTFLESQLPPA